MKLTSVEIHPANSSDVVVLSFRDPKGQNPYNVKNIVGLDADDITSRYYGTSGTSGEKFYSLSLEKRDIVLRIGLNPNFTTDQTFSDLRDALYKMIAASRTGKIQLQFKKQNVVVAAISGFASKFESPNFEKTQEVQLTIKCDDPMLKAINAIDVDIASLDPLLTHIQDDDSTAPHGFTFQMGFIGSVSTLIISDPFNTSWDFRITPVGGFVSGDALYFSSELNDKKLFIIRGALNIPLADVVAPGSIWPIMFPGDNTFAFSNEANLVWNAISYYPTYWGV